MGQVHETQLPGVGVRHEFATRNGDNLGVITHRSGQRDLLLFDRADPDACGKVVRLSEDDARTLAELLGSAQVAERQGALRQSVQGLTIDWLPITPSYSCTNCTVRNTGLRSQTGVTVVAVVRDGHTLPAPDDDFALQAGDMAVIVGSPESIGKAINLLQNGDDSTNATAR